jgi:eukaryotic-like serine/threonine-protein kinase
VAIQCPSCHFSNPDKTNFCAQCATPLTGKDLTWAIPAAADDSRNQGLKTGSVIAGRYEIIECLGQGGMGRVYKAYDLDVREEIALKLIRPEISADPRIIQRFQNELKLARKIAHRNVCRLFDLGRDGNAVFITMEYVSGEDLKTTIHRIGPMTVRKALAVGQQICQGLSEAHGQGVIHRDLKPSNVLIDKEGNVRILDFGIALSPETEGLTDPGSIPGTLQYIAPEILNGQKPEAPSDIYSLGVILYEMVTGRLPFEGPSAIGVAAKQLTEIPNDPGFFNPGLPAALGRLILRCLAKDPAVRFQKAEEVCMGLGRIEEDLAGPEKRSARARLHAKKPSKPGFRWIPAIGLAFACVAAVVVAKVLIRSVGGRPQAHSSNSPANSLIVLPFEHRNMADRQEYISPFILYRMIRNLEKSKGLDVIPYAASIPYKDSALPGPEIAKKSGVNHILKGTITSRDRGFVIDVELLGPKPGEILYSKSYPSETEKDIYPVLDEISRTVADKLGVNLVPERAKPVPGDAQAHRFYSYGLHFQDAYFKSVKTEDFEACVRNYERALEAEPGSAIICWRLGTVYETKYVQDKAEADEKRMLFFWQKAYDLDPNLAEANLAMGWIYFNREDHDRAFPFFQRAIELDKDSAEVNFHVGAFLRSLGLYEQARRHYARALNLEPVPGDFATWHQVLADCDSQLGNAREAADLLSTAMGVNIDANVTLDFAVCLLKLKEPGEAEKQIREARRQGAAPAKLRRYEALCDAAMGRREAALALIRNETDISQPIVPCVHALLGMKDEAIQGISGALGEKGFRRFRWYPYSYLTLKNNLFFDGLRADHRFQSILTGEKARYDEMTRKFGGL